MHADQMLNLIILRLLPCMKSREEQESGIQIDSFSMRAGIQLLRVA